MAIINSANEYHQATTTRAALSSQHIRRLLLLRHRSKTFRAEHVNVAALLNKQDERRSRIDTLLADLIVCVCVLSELTHLMVKR